MVSYVKTQQIEYNVKCDGLSNKDVLGLKHKPKSDISRCPRFKI
jgi:hypothetical protein